MFEKENKKEISAELDKALALLKKSFGFEIIRPNLRIGDKYPSQFIEISSMRDLVRSAQIQMAYDADGNSIFVPDIMTFKRDWPKQNYDKIRRIYCFLHECVHAFLSQKNPQFKNIDTLFESKLKSENEKGQVCVVFDEGTADYIAIQSALQSDDSFLVEYAHEKHEDIMDGWNEWLSSRGFALLAQINHLKPDKWQEVLYRHFQRSFGIILAHKYLIGYIFMHTARPGIDDILKMINLPPWKIRHLLWPEAYLKKLKGRI